MEAIIFKEPGAGNPYARICRGTGPPVGCSFYPNVVGILDDINQNYSPVREGKALIQRFSIDMRYSLLRGLHQLQPTWH